MLEDARVHFVSRLAMATWMHMSALPPPCLQLGSVTLLCRYTGYVRGLGETFGSGPVSAQHRAASPAPGEFLYTRTFVPAISAPERDPCNFPDEYKPSASLPNLWPQEQSTGLSRNSAIHARSSCACNCCKIISVCIKGRAHICCIRQVLTVHEGRMAAGRQPSAKPPSSHLVLGDGRLRPFTSSYSQDFHPPLPGHGKLRSPLRSKEARQPHQLQGLYRSAMQRVGEWVLLSALPPHMRSGLPWASYKGRLGSL